MGDVIQIVMGTYCHGTVSSHSIGGVTVVSKFCRGILQEVKEECPHGDAHNIVICRKCGERWCGDTVYSWKAHEALKRSMRKQDDKNQGDVIYMSNM